MEGTRGTNKRGTRRLAVLLGSLCLAIAVALSGPAGVSLAAPLAQLAPTLGAADSFSILAASLISDANPALTVITGHVGSTGGGAAIGISCTSMAGGSIYSVDAAPIDTCVVNNSAVPGNAQAANTAAFGALIAGVNSTCTTVPVELGGQTLGPGVYCSTGAGVFTLTGPVPLTLSGTGTWIFQSSSTLVTSAGASVVGGGPCDVWWRVPSSATLGTGTQLTGNVLALTDITIASGATLNGRAFAQTGAVTLDGNTITRGPTCAPAPTSEESEEVSGLPDTGGAPIQDGSFPWSLVIIGGASAAALAVGVQAYRRTRLPKQ